MKVNKQIFNQLKSQLETLVEHLGFEQTQQQYHQEKVGTAFWLWHKLYMCISYPDDNPNVFRKADHSRLFKQDASFVLYPCDTNDDTLLTALVKALDQIFEVDKRH